MSYNVTFSNIKPWISPKTAEKQKKEQEPVSQNQQENNEGQKVDASLALATLGVTKTDKKADGLSGMISSELLTGQKGNVTSFFYVNDIHGRLSNMERITTASAKFDDVMPSYVDTLKFSAGDIMLGTNLAVNQAANAFLNANNFMATVVGNHEVDQKTSDFLESTQSAVYKILGSNAKMDKSHRLYNRTISSYVQEDKDKNKYGILALMPFDLKMRSANKELFEGLEIAQMEETKKYLQQEIDKFEEKGINRIVLLSHIGYNNDLEIAKSVKGIDVILGGHSHDLVEGLSEQRNLVISEKDGAPTIITQAGRDGNYYGILNVEFNDKGEIIKAENIVKSTEKLERSQEMHQIFNSILGENEVLGTIGKTSPAPKNNMKEENPHAEFLADVLRETYKTDIAFVSAGTARGAFAKGDINSRDLGEIFPFKDKPAIITVSEKELVEAMKFSASSMAAKDGKPGLAQVSGLQYSVSSDGTLTSLFTVDKRGKKHIININNPDENKTYRMVTPEVIAKGLDGYSMLNKINDESTIVKNFTFKEIVAVYIHNTTKPINIEKSDRINITD